MNLFNILSIYVILRYEDINCSLGKIGNKNTIFALFFLHSRIFGALGYSSLALFLFIFTTIVYLLFLPYIVFHFKCSGFGTWIQCIIIYLRIFPFIFLITSMYKLVWSGGCWLLIWFLLDILRKLKEISLFQHIFFEINLQINLNTF